MTTTQTAATQGTPKVLTTVAERQSERGVNKLIAQAIQSTNKSHAIVQKAAEACLLHFEKYKDARPADRLIKGLPQSFHIQGLVFWFKKNSPIWWNPQQEVKVRKEGEANYVPLNVKQAMAEPWQAVPETAGAMAKVIVPFSMMTVFERVENLGRQMENAIKEDSKRGFDATYGNEAQTRFVLNQITDMLMPYKRQAEQRHRRAEEQATKAAVKRPATKLIKKARSSKAELRKLATIPKANTPIHSAVN